jgi:hypothetical protein
MLNHLVFRVLALLALVMCFGCATPAPESILDSRDPIPQQSIAADVALAPDIADRVELLGQFGGEGRLPVRTGEAWRASFPTGDGKQRALLRIEASSLKWEVKALGFASRFSYAVKAVLQEGDRSTPLTAEGYQHSSMQTLHTPIRMAFIMAVTSIADQARAALKPTPIATSAAQRMRDLEALWRDKLVTEEEYRARREQLLQEL